MMNKPDFFENYFVWAHPARQSSVSIRLKNEDPRENIHIELWIAVLVADDSPS